MKQKNNTGRKATPVRVPSWDPAVLNRDLLNGLADNPMVQGINGWAYQEIGKFIGVSFPMGHNPLETLRRILPQWKWNVSEVEWETNEELEAAVYCNYCSYCGNGVGGGYGEEQVICQWAYHHSNSAESRVYHITAARLTSDLGFVAKTENGSWHFVSYRTEVFRDGAEHDGWNYQPYPPGDPLEKALKGKEGRFAPLGGFIPHGTRPVPVEQVGESRPWNEGSPWGTGEWGRSGYEQDYLLPDGKVQTKRVCTDEWP